MSGTAGDHAEDGDEEDTPRLVKAERDDHTMRLDKVLVRHFPDLSRSRLKSLIESGAVSVAGHKVQDAAFRVYEGNEITLYVPPPVCADPKPEAIALDIIYEDDDLLVIDKQAGLVVHPGAGNSHGTLVNGLLHHCGAALSGIGGVARPGIVHRLDKDTSGLMVVAKNDHAHRHLSAQLSDRTLGRLYVALVWGNMARPRGTIDKPVGRHPANRLKMAVTGRGARHAVTHYERLEQYGIVADLVSCRLETGRTHQIRVHMADAGYPLVGDPVYGMQQNRAQSLMNRGGIGKEIQQDILAFPRQALHARKITFIHPVTEEEMHFESPVPPTLGALIELFKSST